MKKTKKLIIILSAILVTAAVICGIYFACRAAVKAPDIKNNYEEIYRQDSLSLSVSESGLFRILKINDTHFINGKNKDDAKTLAFIKSVLDNTECDLIIADGDLIEGYNIKISFDKYAAAAAFCELIEEYDIPWTLAPGNNDGQKDGTNEQLIAFMMQYDNFICGNAENIDGSMQLFIDLKQGEKTVHSIAVMDSNSLDSRGKYDSIKESQINWLLDGINERKVKTSVFFHMPTPAFKTAYEKGEAYEGFPFSINYSVDNIAENELFDKKTQDNEFISLISIGHVHSNNIAYFYNDRYYQLSSLSGYGAVGADKTIPSFTFTTINTAADNVKDMYRFVKLNAE